MNQMDDLERRMCEKIDDMKMSPMEIRGFQLSPRLAIKAGIAIGYRMGTDDAVAKINQMQNSISKSLGVAAKIPS